MVFKQAIHLIFYLSIIIIIIIKNSFLWYFLTIKSYQQLSTDARVHHTEVLKVKL